ncbi:MAG: radical SAM protein [Candidatus Methanomethylophilaceae archaeon]
MDERIIDLIDSAGKKALSGTELTREEIVALVSIDPDSEECDHLGHVSRMVKEVISGTEVHIGSSIGVDLRPCPMSCRFCSLGEEWGLIEGEYELSDDTVMGLIGGILSKGFDKVTLRTTEFYPIERLCGMARRIRARYGNGFALTANTGELTPETARMLKEAGFNAVYHAVRLREGIDTPLSVERRIATIRAAQSAGLRVSGGLDPIGPDHSPEEIADSILLYRELRTNGICVMRRVSVKGTPYGDSEEISDRRLAQLTAVCRLAGGGSWSVASHPANSLSLRWGGDHIAVETGANPRDNNLCMLQWSVTDHDGARRMAEEAGCVLGDVSDLFREFMHRD